MIDELQPSLTVINCFSAEQAARVSHLTRDMVNYLCRHKIVTPSASNKRGRGVARKYTYADILLLRVISKLLGNGISVLRLRKNLAALQKRGKGTPEIISRKYVATEGYNLYFSDGGVFELFESGQTAFAFVLELTSLRKEVLSSIERDLKVA